MINCEARILMYSGPDWDPRVTLTDEQVDSILEKLANLREPADEKSWGWGLGHNFYLVTIPELCYIYVHPKGYVRLLTEAFETYSIDIGGAMHSYLTDILTPALVKHCKDAQAAMDKHNEKMFGIPKQEEVQHAEGRGNDDPDA